MGSKTKDLAVWKAVGLNGTDFNLVLLTPREAGLKQATDRKNFFRDVAARFGAVPGPRGLGMRVREEYKEQRAGELLRVAEEPAHEGGVPRTLLLQVSVGSSTKSPFLANWDDAEGICYPNEKWAFILPKAAVAAA